MPSFSYGGRYQITINSESIVKVNISCLDHNQQSKDLLSNEHREAGRYDPKEHLRLLQESDSLANPENPMLMFGIRNVMSNYRCIIHTLDKVVTEQAPPYSVIGEKPLLSQRPYFIMAENLTDGKIVLEEYLPSVVKLSQFRWFFSGIPVLWDDLSEEDMFKRIVVEASDHSHVFAIPRGSHPSATDETRDAWQQMHDVFIEDLHKSSDIAYKRLTSLANRLHLAREKSYLQSIVGLNEDNDIVILMARGKLEELGTQIRKEQGAKRAICVESSGSITLLYYPEGIAGPEISLFAAPNHRRPGTAFVLVELKEKSFGLL